MESRTIKIGLALGSGSARGLAHIGAIQELERLGITPSIVCGTSAGALIGAAYVCGRLNEIEAWFVQMTGRDVFRYMDIRGMSRGVGNAERLMEQLRVRFGDPDIESLSCRFAAVGTDLETGRELWLQHGRLWDAVRASLALPGLIAPSRLDGHWVVDGGLVNPVPVSVCRALGADLTIAINLNEDLGGRQRSRLKPTETVVAGPPVDVPPGLLNRLSNGIRERAPSRIAQWLETERRRPPRDAPPGIFSVITNSINIMQDRITRSRLAGEPPDVMISPRLAHIGLLEFEAGAEAIDEGRNAVRRMIPSLQHALGTVIPDP